MAYLQLNFESRFLGNSHPVSVLMPDMPRDETPRDWYAASRRYPVLWLLHGTYADHSDWVRKTNLEVYVQERQLMAVMPNGLNSDYANWPGFASGFDMFTYLTEELMPFIRYALPASARREDSFIAGASMGGRGACLYALNRPELFAGAASFSYPLGDVDALFAPDPHTPSQLRMEARAWNTLRNEGGEDAYRASYENLLRIALEHPDKAPALYFLMGGNDGLLPAQEAFQRQAREAGLNATFEALPGYAHEWRFWDRCLEKALDFFGLPVQRHFDF